MVSVQQAEQIILNQLRHYNTETVAIQQSLGRVLAEDIFADRDMPHFNRVTMDGIAIKFDDYAQGNTSFHIRATQAAGDAPTEIKQPGECIEIMTGAVLPSSADTVIRYEDVLIIGTTAEIIATNIKKGQNIHSKGDDKRLGDVVVSNGQLINPAVISSMASVGKIKVQVKKQPRIVIISSGDELVEIDKSPADYQIRRSNNYTIQAVLHKNGLHADMLHIPDDAGVTAAIIQDCIGKYDVLLLSGGISMGKFDYIPTALENIGVAKLFHKVQQRPGKPFWFGAAENGTLVFAFPGNPVATFMCLHRYFMVWLNAVMGINTAPVFAALDADFVFEPDLQYFLQVKISFNAATLNATPLAGNGSGDFANLVNTNAFMELPANQSKFHAGEVYRIWPFN